MNNTTSTAITVTAGLIRNQKLHLISPISGARGCIGNYRTGVFAVHEVTTNPMPRRWADQTEDQRKEYDLACATALVETLREIADGTIPFEAVCQRCLAKTHEAIVRQVAHIDANLAKLGVTA